MSHPTQVDIPNKTSFKPAEVCDLLGIPAYVLRTWENEFADLGVAKSPGAARSYRRRDVELALRIRELVFAEHLTLAGVRRRLEHEHLIEPAPEEIDSSDALPQGSVSAPARAKIVQVKNELRELLQQLAEGARTQLLTEGSAIAGADSASPERAKTERSPGREPAETPVLPGMEGTSAAPEGATRTAARGGKLDPSALNFASVSAPPPASPSRRRPGKSPR